MIQDPGWSECTPSQGMTVLQWPTISWSMIHDPGSRMIQVHTKPRDDCAGVTNQSNRKTDWSKIQDPGSRMIQVHTKPWDDCAEPTPCSFSPIFPPYCLTPLHRPYVIKCRLYCPNPFETFRYGAVCVSKPSEYFPKPFERTKPSDMWQFACENLQSTSLTPSKKQNLQIWGFFCMSEPFVDFLQIWHSIHPIGILKIQNWS